MHSMLSKQAVECPAGLLARAQRGQRVRTAIVNAGAELPMQSAQLAEQYGLIEPVLIGDASAIKRFAGELGWDISEHAVLAAGDEQEAAQLAVDLARDGMVASLMKGDIHTDNLLRAVLHRDHGLRTERRLSHVFHMTLPGSDDALCITDAAINVLPNLEVKQHIVHNAVELLHRLGNRCPKVALLSATEQASDAMPSSMDAAELTRWAMQGKFPESQVFGPLAFDNAVSEEAARLKGIDSPVAGNAELLVVPSIEAGNMLFKQMVYFMSAAAAGIVLGAKVPITLTSRADPVAARLASIALAAVYVKS